MLKCSSWIGVFFWGKAEEIFSGNIFSYSGLPLAPVTLMEHPFFSPKLAYSLSSSPLGLLDTYPCQLTLFHLTTRFAKLPVARRDGEEGGRREEELHWGICSLPCTGQTSAVCESAGRKIEASSTPLYSACRPTGTGDECCACLCPTCPGQNTVLQPSPPHPAQLPSFESFCYKFCSCPAAIPPPCSLPSPCQPSQLSLGCDSWSSPAWSCRWVLDFWHPGLGCVAVWLCGKHQTAQLCRNLHSNLQSDAGLGFCSVVGLQSLLVWPTAVVGDLRLGGKKTCTNTHPWESWWCSVMFSDTPGSCSCCELSV